MTRLLRHTIFNSSFMKAKPSIFALAFSLLFTACSKDSPALKNLDCEPLVTALLENDDATVDEIMDDVCADFPPDTTDDDMYGHQANLNNIIEDMNAQCPELNASLGCYACLESLPPWSVIEFSLDSAGAAVGRSAHLLTPSDGVMRSNW
jgi:hypothetical protein